MTQNVPAHHKPFPELVEPLPNPFPYTILDTAGKAWLPTNGMASIEHRTLLVPLTAEARSVTRHELAHVKWSPRRLPKVPFDVRYLMSVEDARGNLGLVRVGLPVLLGPAELAHVVRLSREDVAARDLHAFVLRAVAALGTNADLGVLAEIAAEERAARDVVLGHVRRVRIALLRGAR